MNNFPYKSICIFCGSADGLNPEFYKAAEDLGRMLAENGITLVYGAGRTGMMGAVARGALGAGGEVIGIVPVGLESPQLVYTTGLSRLEVVENIQVRKARMNELSDAFIALPGGFGTLDELFEVLTWSQIGLHRKPAAFYNVEGYYDALLEWVNRAYKEHFIYEEHLGLFVEDHTAKGLLQKLSEYHFPESIERWLERD